MAASCVHEGDCEHALDPVRKRAKIAEAGGDRASFSADQILMGDVLLHAGQAEEALSHYQHAVEIMETADVPAEVKENARRNHYYRRARVALALGDIQAAREMAGSFGERISARQDPAELRDHHELLGRIALHEGDFDLALNELAQSDQQDPVVLYLTAQAWKGAGNEGKSRELLALAANFNALDFNYAFVRAKARANLEEIRP
jgi:tetratricopeptide (TPR) repeat protein